VYKDKQTAFAVQ